MGRGEVIAGLGVGTAPGLRPWGGEPKVNSAVFADLLDTWHEGSLGWASGHSGVGGGDGPRVKTRGVGDLKGTTAST